MNLRGVSTNKKYYTVCFIAMQSYKELDILSVVSRGSSDGFNMVGCLTTCSDVIKNYFENCVHVSSVGSCHARIYFQVVRDEGHLDSDIHRTCFFKLAKIVRKLTRLHLQLLLRFPIQSSSSGFDICERVEEL
jgi:hypothetical protein